MRLRIKIDELKNLLSKMYFPNEGEKEEKKYWALFKERFPNLEIFWRWFIVPATRRIENEKDRTSRIEYGEGVHSSIKRIVSLHYFIFKNMLFCWQDSEDYRKRLSYFYDFWAHLVSILDLTEIFLLENYKLKCTCYWREIDIPELDKRTFLDKAEDWYGSEYPKRRNDFLKKWRPVIWGIHKRKDLLASYFSKSEEWKKYDRRSQNIRAYRNFAIHDIGPGKIERRSKDGSRMVWVPKLEKVSRYKTWQDFYRILNNGKGMDDAITDQEIMMSVLSQVQSMLNKLWTKPIHDTKKLFEKKNDILLEKYNIELL